MIGEQDIEPRTRCTRSGGQHRVTENIQRETRRVVTTLELAARLGPTRKGVGASIILREFREPGRPCRLDPGRLAIIA